jgi:putative transcriptional regulator
LNTINDLLPEINASFKIYNGGPVNKTISIINIPELIPNSIEISNGIYWGGDFESTKALINNGKINNIRFFLGYTVGNPITVGNDIKFMDCCC